MDWPWVGTCGRDPPLDAIDGYAVGLEEVGGGDRTQLDNEYELGEPEAEETSAT